MAQRLAAALTDVAEALDEDVSVALLTADLLDALASLGLELTEGVGPENYASLAYLKHIREDPEIQAEAVEEYVERKQRHRLN